MRLNQNSTPAERARGCVFAEDFENTQAVAENGGTITGDTIINNGATFDGTGDYIDYPYTSPINMPDHTISVDFDFTAGRGTTQILAQWGDGVSTANSGAIVITANDTVRFSVNNGVAVYTNGALTTGRHTVTCRYGGGAGASRATAVDGVEYSLSTTTGGAGSSTAGITIGAETDHTDPFLGKIHSVKIFNNQLTLQEHTDYYNNSTYDYINTPVLDLPMGMAQHDPTNTRTLDVSRSGAHATLINSPTKLTDDKGYDFNGTQAMTATATGVFNTAEVAIAITFSPDYDADDDTIDLMFFDCTDGSRYLLYQAATRSLTINLGNTDVALVSYTVYQSLWRKGEENIIVISAKSGDTNLWLNGHQIITSSATAWTPANPSTLFIAERLNGIRFYRGKMHRFRVWQKMLTPLQIKDLYIREFKQINDI